MCIRDSSLMWRRTVREKSSLTARSPSPRTRRPRSFLSWSANKTAEDSLRLRGALDHRWPAPTLLADNRLPRITRRYPGVLSDDGLVALFTHPGDAQWTEILPVEHLEEAPEAPKGAYS